MQRPPNVHTWTGRTTAVLAGLIALIAIGVLAFNVARDMRLLDSATSDNVQWTVAQSEVEFLEFTREIALTQATPDRPLRNLRRRFDVFYSRINTLATASTYGELFKEQDYRDAMNDVQAFLNATVVLIDSDDAILRAALPDISASADTTRGSVRRLSNSGLNHFAEVSDARREAILVTLVQLAVVVVGLILALAVAVIYLAGLNAQNLRRRREISETAARMNTIISTSLDAVIVSNSGGRIIEFNSAAEAIFGHSAADAVGRDLGKLIIPDHLRDAHDKGMKRMRDGGPKRVVGHGRVKLEGKRSNGEVFPVELAIQSADTDDGEIFIAFLRDISARVSAEQQLVAARDRAMASERLKTEFLATMSHEIRTPLNGLLGNLALMKDTNTDSRQGRYIGNMEKSGRLLLSHVTDVLDITRYDAGKLILRKEAMNLGALLQDIIDSQSGSASAQGTSLEWGWDGPAQNWIESDPDRLQHILLNLIGNAVKFTRNGKVTVTARTFVNDDDARQIEFQIKDTGTGITPELQGHIFDDFVTGNTAYDREVGGTGLGLSIARRFAHAMGGDIGLTESSPKGTTFWVRLPIVSAAPPVAEAVVERHEQPDRPLKILIVEDNEINRVVVREMLHAAGHSTTEAHDGAAGVELASQSRFDLILMDISMPVMDGRVATRTIRAGDGASAKAPIVALTANAMEEEQAAFLEDGMNDILTKPLSRDALTRITRNVGAPASAPQVTVTDPSHTEEMRGSLGENGYKMLLDRFIAEAEDLVSWLDDIDTHDPADVKARCHKVAGSAAVFGATAFRGALATIETAIKAGDTATAHSEASRIGPIWTATHAVLTA